LFVLHFSLFKFVIFSGEERQFQIPPEAANIFTTYDYKSVMHYPDTAFSIDGVSKTIVPLVSLNFKFLNIFS